MYSGPTKTKKTTVKVAIKRISIKVEGDEQVFGDRIASYAAGLEDGTFASKLTTFVRETFATPPARATAQTGECPASPDVAS